MGNEAVTKFHCSAFVSSVDRVSFIEGLSATDGMDGWLTQRVQGMWMRALT